MKLFLAALALAFAMEGILYAAFPEFMQKRMKEICAGPPATLRLLGICALICSIIAGLVSRQLP